MKNPLDNKGVEYAILAAIGVFVVGSVVYYRSKKKKK